MAKVAVVLSGCGVFDGSEIHEAVLCLLALARAGHTYSCFAPDMEQAAVINHTTQQATAGESRNVLVESARIARGEISPLSELKTEHFDAILLPGGFGAARNLSNYADLGPKCEVLPELQKILLEFHRQAKPIGATCITPAILAKVFSGITKVTLTLGLSEKAKDDLNTMGAEGVVADVRTVIADEKNRIYTTPCYMEPQDLPGMFEAVTQLVDYLGKRTTS